MLAGEIPVSRLTYLAVLRHYRDLKAAGERGFYFDHAKAWHVIRFIERFCVHIKGNLANQPLLLDPWQRFWTAVLYGWRRKSDGLRRFLRGYEEVPRKNGKSTWKGGQGLYLFAFDAEPGAEVYAVATTRAQAMTVFRPAFDNVRRWARRSPGVDRSFRIFAGLNQERVELDTSIMAPLPANAENLDGLNPSAILFDELHAQKSRDVWDVMETALGARRAPLLSAITTAGYILDGICVEIRTYLVSILEGRHQDDTFFGYVYTIDRDDQPTDPATWHKANPGLGLSKRVDYMAAMARKAAVLPSARVNFLTKDLNVWCNSADGWFDLDQWDKCRGEVDLEALRGRPCYGGLDLGATRDLTAFALVFPPVEEGEPWKLAVWSWCPQERIDHHEADDVAAYKRWQAEGWITGIPGAVTSHDPVRERIVRCAAEFDLREVGFDRWNALQLATTLIEQHDIVMVETPQNTGGMYPGSKKLEELIYSGDLAHGGNPVLRYCAANVALLFDSNGNFRPDKKKSTPNGRIDLIVAAVMALGRAVATRETSIDEFISSPIIG